MAVRVESIPTVPGMGRSLIEHDDMSREYPARGILARDGVPRRNKTWRRGYAYDQGSTSACVGNTFKGVLNTGPLASYVDYSVRHYYDPFQFYLGAQDNDEWPGREPDYEGTSANGQCKYLRSIGLVSEWRWCFGLDDVLDTLSQYGPVGIGIWWWDSMWQTDSEGFLTVSGQKVGGHEVEIHGINIDQEYVIGTNSWSRLWGLNGRFKLRWTELDKLLQDDGDAVTVVSIPQEAAA